MEGIPIEQRELLERNLAAVRTRVAAALQRAGRPEDACRLVAVTKSVSSEVTAALLDLGQIDLGESRPEVLIAKRAAIGEAAEGARWHMIGHYQRRKVRDSLALCDLVHSVHDLPLLEALDRRAGSLNRPVPVLLQVNVAGEDSKQGFNPSAVSEVLETMGESPNLEAVGLMTMAPAGLDSAPLREVFSSLRSLRDRLATPDRPLPELSMGMSGDFEEAILEGSTLVRVGSALFEGLRN